MIPPGRIYPDPPPMPNVRAALVHVPDMRAAVERAAKAWNKSQLDDAIRSLKYYIALAEDNL